MAQRGSSKMSKGIRTSGLSIKNSFSLQTAGVRRGGVAPPWIKFKGFGISVRSGGLRVKSFGYTQALRLKLEGLGRFSLPLLDLSLGLDLCLGSGLGGEALG